MSIMTPNAASAWIAPVYVRIGSGSPERIRGSVDALSSLLHRWPAAKGQAHASAVALCSESETHPDRCREAFVKAAIDAEMFDM
ncbi:DUF982 domain-containing protein [Neorhizobium lilium]|uniref:DUF982 domain-containing protein n=1 Tax=Neorhizobium lilium TaxID=2503024 RepID=A0A3S3U4E6_9HYPH|nr:DUF982 domain-containing protein [Neorhizobium lilium]RWX81687.1 DUF982 domain-containing protein [Neorhizobium lilium]